MDYRRGLLERLKSLQERVGQKRSPGGGDADDRIWAEETDLIQLVQTKIRSRIELDPEEVIRLAKEVDSENADSLAALF